MAVVKTLLFSGFFAVSVAFADNGKRQEKTDIASETSLTIENLDTEAFEDFINSLGDEQRSSLGIKDLVSFLKSASSGESKDFFTAFLSALWEAVKKYFIGFLPSCLTIVIVCLLKNMLANMTSGFLDTSTTEVVHIVCYSVVIIILMAGVVSVITSVTETVSSLTKFGNVLFPILLTLLSALGGTTGISTYQPMMAALSAVVLNVISAVVLPAFIACVVISVVGNLSKNVKLTKLTKLFRSGAGWLIGIIFGLFGTFLTIGGISGSVIDKIGYNAAKFAVSSYVPLLGGYLSDGFDLVTASLVLVKNALGYTGVAVLASVVLFPVLKLIVFTLSLRLTAAIVEPIGDERVANMLSATADNSKLLITALAGAAFMFLILIMLVIGTCNFAV